MHNPNHNKPFQELPPLSFPRFARINKRKSASALEHVYLLKNLEWYEPPENSGPVHFFRDTSLHGLKYLGQRKRHICERIFWFIAFTMSVVLSVILISHVWDQYRDMPIVTVFNPEEKKLNQIPFPAVTICSVNKIKRSIWDGHTSDAINGTNSKETTLQKLASITDVDHVCHSAKTFTHKFLNISSRISEELRQELIKHRGQYDHLFDTLSTLGNASQSCEDMILYCVWLDGIQNCNELFQPVITDYGNCCVFNMVPLSLLRKFRKGTKDHPPQMLKDWEEADLNYDNLIIDNIEQNTRKYPHRQRYPGRSAGLSFLVDPHMEDYYCPNTDSEGFIIGLNTPLDFPRMKDNGIAFQTGTEVFIGVQPEITISADSVRKFELEKRQCYVEGEKELAHYTKYTSSNCMDECVAKKTLEECKCLRYYMPRGRFKNETNCRVWQYDCTEHVREKIIKGEMDDECNDCLPSCTEILYHMQTTSLQIREERILELLEKNSHKHENYNELRLRARNASIIHVYISIDSVFPRLRKEKMTIIDLIASAGGLLGLCMGFSLLSLLEILYHGTLRVFCNFHRKRLQEKAIAGDSTNAHNLDNNGLWQFNILQNCQPRKSNAVQEDIFKIGKSGTNKMLPVYFRTPFEADFKRAYFATAAGPTYY